LYGRSATGPSEPTFRRPSVATGVRAAIPPSVERNATVVG
jgi:hypothetical protein